MVHTEGEALRDPATEREEGRQTAAEDDWVLQFNKVLE